MSGVFGPFKCPDCGIWWAGMEHRCQPGAIRVGPNAPSWPAIGGPVRCTCPPERGDNYRGSCPIHDTQITYTAGRS